MKTVFEIGCNMGSYLYPFFQRGWEVAGVDFGSENLEFGRNKSGMPHLYSGGIEQLEQLNKKADLILCNHVVEHFVGLEKELARIRNLLKPGGLFFVGLPGTFWWPIYACGGDFAPMWQNAHCWQFSLNSWRYVIECSGFEMVYGDEIIRAIGRPTDKFREKRDVFPDEYSKVTVFLEKLSKKRLYYRFKSDLRSTVLKVLKALGIKGIVKKILGKR